MRIYLKSADKILSLTLHNILFKEVLFMINHLKSCQLCHRYCKVDRLKGNTGFCHAGKDVKIAKVCLHTWEEPCISGNKGSGTIFFSNCNFRCAFCQNYKISANGLGKEISIAAKAGADPDSNGKLRDVIAKAKSCNMPNDTINRAIKRGSGELGDVNYEEIIYEGYASGGVAVIVNTLTENRNRTAGDVRHIFDKNGARHTPREWFIVPLEVIEEAVEFIISGEIIDYRYDVERQTIVGK